MCHAGPRTAVRYARVVDVARENPALSIPVTAGRAAAAQKGADLPRPVVANCRWVHAMQDTQTETIKPRSSDDPVLREIVRRLVGAYWRTGQPEPRGFLPENRSVQADRFSIGFRKISPTQSHPDIAPSFLPFPTGQLLPRLIVVNIRQYLQRRSFSGSGTIK